MGHLELVRQDFTSKHEEKQRNKIPYVAYSIKLNKIIYNITVKDTTIPSVTTVNVDLISETSAIIKCVITKDGGTPVTKCGVIYGTTSGLTNNVTEIESGSNMSTFEVELKNLNSNTTYYVKAYATNKVGSSYGNVLSFTTNTVDKPVVLSISVDNVTDTTAILSGNIIGESDILEKGFVYSTNTNPTINNNKIPVGSGLGSFSKTLEKLSEITPYYVRSYAITANTVVHYSDVVNFITEAGYSNHEYVDLGLPSGTKWATMNIGASKPEDVGYYFAWGEVEPKETFYANNYKWFDSDGLLTKYNSNIDYGIVDYKTELDLEDDAAHHIWGKGWKMPTLKLLTELGNLCTFKNVQYNDTKGVLVTGPNGNSLLVPASGGMSESSILEPDYPYLLTQALYSETSYANLLIGFYDGELWVLCTPFPIYRIMGFPIRPVIETSLVPSLLNTAIYNISEDSADVRCDVQSEGSLIDKGVVISTKNKPTIQDTKISCNTGKDSLECHLSNLNPNTTYYVRTYAINDVGIGYGYELTFTTDPINANGYSYVDLGLPSGILWASHNVGASKPEEYGDYFAWGETQPKSTYDWSTYKYCNGSDTTLAKYCTNSSYGTVDNKTQLELTDDAARVNWGGGWRTPTTSEILELVLKCLWEEATENSIKGYKVIGTNGNSIFLPLSGIKIDSNFGGENTLGLYYMSFTLDNLPNNSYTFDITNVLSKLAYNLKCYGLTIRPVLGNQPILEPVVVSINSDGITSSDNVATVTCSISTSKPVSIEETGVIYSSINTNPLITDARKIGPSNLGLFSVVLNDLSYGTVYYVRAYAIYDNKIYYGNISSVET